jgi:hypothetical protein
LGSWAWGPVVSTALITTTSFIDAKYFENLVALIVLFQFEAPTLSNFNGRQGGIWMSGGAPASDGSKLYLITGNGNFDGTKDFGDRFLKLSTSSGPSLTDWFTPYDESSLDGGDQETGSRGATVLVDLPLKPGTASPDWRRQAR